MEDVIKKSEFRTKSIDIKKVVFCIGLGLFLNSIISTLLSLLLPIIPEKLSETLDSSVSFALTGNPVLILIGAGILVPIMEEIIFRHGIHRTLSRSNLAVAYIVSSLVFGLAHGNVIQGIYATILGLIFAFILTNTDNLLYPIIIHMSINSSSAIITFLPESTSELLVLGIIFVFSLILTLPFIRSKSVKELFSK